MRKQRNDIASAFWHPVSPSGTGTFRYRTGSPYSGTGLIPASAFLFILVPDSPTFRHIKKGTHCTSILLAVEMPYTLQVHSAGCGNGYTLQVHSAGCGNGYTLQVHSAGCGNGTPCMSILMAMERHRPCTSILWPASPFCWLWK
jgi:hypothetical protein